MHCYCRERCGCYRRSIFGKLLEAIAETIEEVDRTHARAKQFEEDTREKYKDTRVVVIALRSYVNFWGGKNKKSFWYAHEDTQESVLAFAEREWKNDPNSWGPMYWLVGLLQRLSSPLIWSARGFHQLVYFLDERKMIPCEWNSMDAQKRRYRIVNALERNWNQTVFRK